MKKRSFKQQVKHAQKAILEQNKEKYEKLMDQYYSEIPKHAEKKAFNSKTLFISLSSVFAVFIIISLFTLWSIFFPSLDSTSAKHYLTENEVYTEIDLLELNSNLNSFSIELQDIYNTKIERVYDSESHDILYYKLQLINDDETFETIFIEIYTNPNFKNRKKLPDDVNYKTLGEFNLIYNENIQDDEWAYIIKFLALTEYNDIMIFINYEQLSLDNQNNFFNFFMKTIKAI